MRRKKNLKACHFADKTDYINYHSRKNIIPVEIVELEDNSYHLITSVEINGLKGDVIIDTGASVTVIDKNILSGDEKHNKDVKIQSGSVTGQITDIKVIHAKHMQIGNARFKNIRLAAIDLDYVNEMYNERLKRKIIGLLGSDFCVKHAVVIDYQKKILICRR